MTQQKKISAGAMTLSRGGRDVLQAESLAFGGGVDSSLLARGGQCSVQTQWAGRLMDVVESSLDSVKEYTRSSVESERG